MASKRKQLLAMEDQNGVAEAVNALAPKKRPADTSFMALAGPSAKVKKDTPAAPEANAAPNKARAVPRSGKKTIPIDVVGKLAEFLATIRGQEERDEAYNKMKLEEVKKYLDTLSRPNIMKAVPDCVLSEDAPSILNLLLDGLGESTKHGNKMVFAVMKAIVKNMGDSEAVPKEKFSSIHKVIYVHNQCQLTMKQHFEIINLICIETLMCALYCRKINYEVILFLFVRL
ncbi:hypothetical protein DAPPUDRAFT_334843 [Daphnia pulex]|uniref:Uncharacterized protein n=1 Tax=Daphnia pulex TaxID=6669 RepID=E9HWI7_DAPPU|nr:hypothetical protein DAPPUDRAFT_334843 [Daphnia pulex]|eukprot:EFX63893.1 hypothetical protein DAPPUDRAFT_334843 [Daphnia pulex]